jgi:CRISPR-associated endonuclease/helicase Cas3
MQRDFADDLFAPEAITRYFEEVYWRKGREQLDRGVVDKESIVAKFALDRLSGAVFAYRSAAENFRMIESGMVPVIIPGDEIAEQAVRQLSDEMVPTGRLARTLQSYTVAIPPRARDTLIEAGHASFVAADLRGAAFVVLQHMDLYHKDVGLIWEDAGYLSAEQSMV